MRGGSSESIHPFSFRQLSYHPGVIHIVSCRHGGISEEPYDSLNLGFHVGDDPEAVLHNRELLCIMIGANPRWLTTAAQVHGTHIAVIRETDRGRGALDAESRLPGTDAMITNVPSIPLMVLTADCAAIGLYDPKRRAIGVAHAGWRGTAARITERVVRKMKEVFSSDPADILANVGPSIGPCCYEVDQDVIESFHESFAEMGSRFFTFREGKAYLNLWEANRWQLVEVGVKRANIELAGLCNACHTNMFYSHRAEQGQTGRYGSVVMLRGSHGTARER